MERIKFLVMDVDGTLTDGKIYMGENGEIMKAFCARDGYATHTLLPRYEIKPVIITGRTSKIVEQRMLELKVDLVFQGARDKLSVLKKLVADNSAALDNVAFIGDDVNDLDCINACGISGCPADAHGEVKQAVDFISSKNGGDGAVRDFIEWLAKSSD